MTDGLQIVIFTVMLVSLLNKSKKEKILFKHFCKIRKAESRMGDVILDFKNVFKCIKYTEGQSD